MYDFSNIRYLQVRQIRARHLRARHLELKAFGPRDRPALARTRSQRDRLRHAAPADDDPYLPASWGLTYQAHKLFGPFDPLAIELEDHVADLQARLRSRAVILHSRDLDATLLAERKRLRALRVNLGNTDT